VLEKTCIENTDYNNMEDVVSLIRDYITQVRMDYLYKISHPNEFEGMMGYTELQHYQYLFEVEIEIGIALNHLSPIELARLGILLNQLNFKLV
jgi:hypothetical protein